uniref:Uncharacterized protein n=1 Tax=Anguilla anguilla TaxID=7936 RepID=A0A0E9QDK0_ANGAN
MLCKAVRASLSFPSTQRKSVPLSDLIEQNITLY